MPDAPVVIDFLAYRPHTLVVRKQLNLARAVKQDVFPLAGFLYTLLQPINIGLEILHAVHQPCHFEFKDLLFGVQGLGAPPLGPSLGLRV